MEDTAPKFHVDSMGDLKTTVLTCKPEAAMSVTPFSTYLSTSNPNDQESNEKQEKKVWELMSNQKFCIWS